MKKKLFLGAGLALVACLGAGLALSGEGKQGQEKGAPPGGAPDMAEMMKQWQALATPGPNHKVLEPLVGTFEVSTKMWMAPGEPPMESKGAAVNRWVLDGRFLSQEFEGTMPMPGGNLPFKGMGLTGYDNYRNVYQGTWVDSMGTMILTMTGSFNPTRKELNMYGAMDEPALKVVGRTVRYATRIIDRDHHVFEMYDLHAAPDYKVMEISYTRKR